MAESSGLRPKYNPLLTTWKVGKDRHAWYRPYVARLLLAVWLSAFMVQTTDLLTLVAPDECAGETRGSATDPCRDGCPRCLCCARVPVFVPQVATIVVGHQIIRDGVLPPGDPSTTPSPHGVYHVPKYFLT